MKPTIASLTCTCAQGVLCDEARHLKRASIEAWERYTARPTPLNLTDWQQKEAALNAHKAAAHSPALTQKESGQ